MGGFRIAVEGESAPASVGRWIASRASLICLMVEGESAPASVGRDGYKL